MNLKFLGFLIFFFYYFRDCLGGYRFVNRGIHNMSNKVKGQSVSRMQTHKGTHSES